MTESTTAVGRAAGWRYYVRIATNSFATMLDLGLYALGASLAGLGLALILAALGLVDRETGLSTGSGLVSAMVLGIAGAFLMGIASEGPARRNHRAHVRNELERALSRAVSSVLVGTGLIFVAGVLRVLVEDFPVPLAKGVDLMRIAGIAGLWPVPLFGVPLAWAVRHPAVLGEGGIEAELPIMFTAWVLALLLLS